MIQPIVSPIKQNISQDIKAESPFLIHEALNNGNFDTAGTGGFDWWLEQPTGGSTVNRDTSDKYSGPSSCRFDIDGANSFVGIRSPSGAFLTAGQQYRCVLFAKGSVNGLRIQEFDSSTLIGTLTTAWQRFEFIYTPAGVVFGVKRDGSSGTANQSIWIDSLQLMEW